MKTRRSTTNSPRRNFSHRPMGFTLIEIIMAISIMGMLIAMVSPFMTQIDQIDRGQITLDKFEQIRKAILGPRDSFDENGYRVAGGFVGDMGYLPELYNCDFDKEAEHWVWDTTSEDHKDGHNRPMNQPYGLWMERWADEVDESSTDFLNLRKEGPWNGPYLNPPEDPYPNDASHYQWSEENKYASENDEVRMRSVSGRLSDGWGRSFLFWKEGTGIATTLWIISEGPDQVSAWGSKKNGSWGYHHTPADAATAQQGNDAINFNADNIILKITPNEWYQHNVQVKTDKTVRTLENLRAAIIGPRNTYDEYGNPAIGGYVADIGDLPTLYNIQWDEDETRWLWDSKAYTETLSDTHPWGQPRGLWDNKWMDEVGAVGSPVELSDCWSGAYVPFPRDSNPLDTMHHNWSDADDRDEIMMRETEEKLSDAWGRSLIFWADERETSTTLWIISEGIDRQSIWKTQAGADLWPGALDDEWELLPENRDNIIMKIAPNEWHRTSHSSSSTGDMSGSSGSSESNDEMTSLLAVKVSVDMSNNADIDSYDSSLGLYNENSNSSSAAVISTNSGDSNRITMGNNSTIYGSVFVAPGANPDLVISASHADITGSMGNLTELVNIPDIASPENMPPNEGDLSLSNNSNVTISNDRHFENMSLANNVILTIDGQVRLQVDASFATVGNNSEIRLTAGSTLRIYISGSFILSNNAFVNENGRPKAVQLYVTSNGQQVMLDNNAEFSGTIYNPGGMLSIMNNGTLYGAYQGNDFECLNNGITHLDTSLLE